MYILHRRAKRTRTIVSLTVVGLLLLGGVWWGRQWLRPVSIVGSAPAAVVTHVQDPRTAVKHIDTPQVLFDLPPDWEAFTPTEAPAGGAASGQSYRNTANNKAVRVITVFVDKLPANFAVNRVVPVTAAGDRLGVIDDVSDNCFNFTNHDQPSPTDTAPAKWQNVSFICDTGNRYRNVVGTASSGGINMIKLAGPSTGAHRLFVTYTDASASPDFGIFDTMLRSLRVK
jgi:hypothetical protein